MNPHDHLINSLADGADELLSGQTREEARETLLDYLKKNHAQIPPTDRRQILDAVTRILDAEDFFSATPGDDPSDTDDNAPADSDD